MSGVAIGIGRDEHLAVRVATQDVDGARQILFRRADLEGFDPEKLVSGRSTETIGAVLSILMGKIPPRGIVPSLSEIS